MDHDDPTPPPARPAINGRQGSPTVTVAFPFSTVRVEANDHAVDAVADLADLVARLADAAALPGGSARRGELRQVAADARDLALHLRSSQPEG